MNHELNLISLSNSQLAKKLYHGELTEQEIKQLPAQVVYLALKTIGLDSAQEIITALSPHQYQLALDFEFWSDDRINENQVWNWLTVIDENTDFEALDNFLKQVDQNILIFFICKYVQVEVHEEPTEMPPTAQAYTPDLGYTWLTIETGNVENDRKLGKILAYIFEQNPDYFYRLMYMPHSCTPSFLEETSFLAKETRISTEGIPELKLAWQMNSALEIKAILPLLKNATKTDYNFFKKSNYPLPKGVYSIEPLRTFIQTIIQDNQNLIFDIEYDFAGLLNAAIVFCKIDFSDFEQIQKLAEKVKGAVNLGLEKLSNELSDESITNYALIYKQVGIQNLYRLGLTELKNLKLFAQKIIRELPPDTNLEPALTVVLETLTSLFPEYPVLIDELKQNSAILNLLPTTKAFEKLSELEEAKAFLQPVITMNL
ncbi:MAG: DUF6178 family protein [Deltaproteobacteria bacterium]|jgi:hypothetical protein|nr:DUF6178 family protein [Deltaproteobacteria bacterium]